MALKNLCERRDFRVAIVLALALSSCGALVVLRMARNLSFNYLFLVWNLVLATLPLVFSSTLTYVQDENGAFSGRFLTRSWKLCSAWLWLLFFPNAPYIVTDLVHLKDIHGKALWLDLLMVSSCALTGLALGYASLAQMHGLFERANRPRMAWGFLAATFFLSGFGIYLGRFQRWSSVDILRRPVSLLPDIADRFINPLHRPRTWGVTIGFSIFLALGYALIRLIQTGNTLAERSVQKI
jgi:uncharacterized membrane protein